MKRTTVKSNRTDNSEEAMEKALRAAFVKLTAGDWNAYVHIEWLYERGNGSRSALVAIYKRTADGKGYDAGLGVWYANVPSRSDAPITIAWAWRRPSIWPLGESLPYRPALLPLRLARLCPDFNADDPFDGAADFHPVRS